jgi:hypothetical protein
MPNGQVGMVDGPSHENGGIAVNLPEGTRIWSDKLRYGGKTFAKHTKPITSKIARLEKEIAKNPNNSEAKQNSVMLLNQQLDHYFDVQETNKEANEMKRTFKNGGMIKRADGSYSRRGLWDNIRANKGSGKKPTPQMLEQERKINNEMEMGGYMYGNGGTNNPGFRALPEEVQQNILANMAMGGQMYGMGGSLNMYQRGGRRLNLETPNNNMEQRWIKPEDNTPQSVNSFLYPVEPDFDMNNISEELYGNYGQSLPKPIMATTRSMNERIGTPPTMPPIERATGRYGEFVRPQVTSPGTGVYNPDYKEFNPFNKNEGARFSTPYAMDYETDPNIPKGLSPEEAAKAGMDNLGFIQPNPPGFFNKAGQFIQNNPGLVGQLGTAAITAGIQSGRVNKLARPRTLGDVRLTDKVINPNLVDYSAERQAYNRMGLNAMDEAQRGFGSSAAAQAFKNKARLNTLEGTGKSYQSQENTNAQIRNAANMARQEAGMREAMMNNEIDKYNLENVYGYDTMTTAQKNAITAMLGNTAGQAFGKQSDYANQLEQANILSNQYDPSVLNDMIKNGKLKVVDGKIVRAEYGGMIKRSFRNGGTNNPGFNALPEAVQKNILNNMGMGGYMYPMGRRLMNEPMYGEGGIHIKPENKGKFTAYAKSHGKGVQEMASAVLANKENYSPTIVKRANFAKNAAGWKHENGGYVEYAEGGNVNPYKQALNKVTDFQTSKAAEQMDAEYAAALAAGKNKYTSSITGLDYKVLPKAEKRALVVDMWRDAHGEAPTQKQIESGVKAIEGKKVTSPKAKEVANVAKSQESMQDMISKKWTTGTYTPAAPEPEGPSMMERGEQFYEEQMLPAARTLKKNFKEGVEKGYDDLKDVYGKAKAMGKQAYASLENAEYPDVTAGSRMDTRTKGEDAANSLPLPITMLSRDLFSKVKDRTITEKDLTKGELETLKMTLNGVKKATGRDYLKYADYDNKKGSKMSNLDLIREIVGNYDNQKLKYAFGQGNFRQEGDSTIFEDTYNFNDRNNQGYMDNVSNRLAKGDNTLYAPFRALGTTYGSPEGQGNKVRVAMYNPKGKRSLKK